MNAESQLMVDLDELTWPITWRFRLSAPWGETQQTVSADVPIFAGDHNSSVALGRELWLRSLAAASTRSVQLEGWDTTEWRAGIGSTPMLANNTFGAQLHSGTRREDSGMLVLHTGHPDGYGRRKLPLPCMPSTWVDSGRLTHSGWSALLTLAEAVQIGMQGQALAAPMQLLTAYPGAVDRTIGNPQGVAFRRVLSLRVCLYTGRAPDPTSGLL